MRLQSFLQRLPPRHVDQPGHRRECVQDTSKRTPDGTLSPEYNSVLKWYSESVSSVSFERTNLSFRLNQNPDRSRIRSTQVS